MKQDLACQLCHEKVYSDIGKGCEMCGMTIEDKDREGENKKEGGKIKNVINRKNI